MREKRINKYGAGSRDVSNGICENRNKVREGLINKVFTSIYKVFLSLNFVVHWINISVQSPDGDELRLYSAMDC